MLQYELLDQSIRESQGDELEQTITDSPCFAQSSYLKDEWTKVAESTLPLKQSYLAIVNQADGRNSFLASMDLRSRFISRKVIWINLISVLINLSLAVVAFYYAFARDSSAITAFAADCVLDFISSAIVLWRYFGSTLNREYMEAREQIACIYLGALFELSSIGIIVKGASDIICDSYANSVAESEQEAKGSVELVYLATAATLACIVLTVFKSTLYKELRDKSILLDVINTLISTVFAISIVMSQILMSVDSSFWYLDPVLSIILALFMMAFGLKVLHQNLNILKPVSHSLNPHQILSSGNQSSMRCLDSTNSLPGGSPNMIEIPENERNLGKRSKHSHYGTNLSMSWENDKSYSWQKPPLS